MKLISFFIVLPQLNLMHQYRKLIEKNCRILNLIIVIIINFRYNFKQNTLGSKYMVDFIKQFNHLEHFIYVSTAFVNCQIKVFEDEIMDFQDDIDIIINKFL